MLDVEDEFVHQLIGPGEVKNFKAGRIVMVTAICGKRWTPTLFDNFGDRKKCPECFPKRSPFAIAA